MNTQPTTLVLGATGSIGYALTANLLTRQLPVTILVRNREKARKLFLEATTLTIVEGDAQDADLLKKTAAGKDFIFHGINYPYNQWFGNMDVVTQKVLDAATPHTTIIFPGNIYSFGLASEPIRENSSPNPRSRKGELRLAIEQQLEKAANLGKCRVINVRMPDFWGPNVLNEGIRPIFENAPSGKAMPWLLNVDIPHQSVYTLDAAEVIARLMLQHKTATSKPYEVWNYGGQTLPSMRWFFGQIAALTGHPLKVQVYSRLMINILSLFMPILREVKEMSYLYENTVLLDDSKVRNLFPDFRETPLKEALAQTLAWFADHQKTGKN